MIVRFNFILISPLFIYSPAGCGNDDFSDLDKFIQEVKASRKGRLNLCRKIR